VSVCTNVRVYAGVCRYVYVCRCVHVCVSSSLLVSVTWRHTRSPQLLLLRAYFVLVEGGKKLGELPKSSKVMQGFVVLDPNEKFQHVIDLFATGAVQRAVRTGRVVLLPVRGSKPRKPCSVLTPTYNTPTYNTHPHPHTTHTHTHTHIHTHTNKQTHTHTPAVGLVVAHIPSSLVILF
jgi:hypothetical protein